MRFKYFCERYDELDQYLKLNKDTYQGMHAMYSHLTPENKETFIKHISRYLK